MDPPVASVPSPDPALPPQRQVDHGQEYGNGQINGTWFPALLVRPEWWGGYGLSTFRADLVAGLTMAAYMVPTALGDASLAGLPPEVGLYACLFSGLVFWFFCASRHTSVTVTTAISLLVGTALAPLSTGDPVRHAVLAAALAMLTAILALLAWLVRAGTMVHFISESVLIGFRSGVALVLVSTQLPKLLGFSAGRGDFWERISHAVRDLDQSHGVTILTGLVCLGVLLMGHRWWRHGPVALLVVVGSIAGTALFQLGDRGVKLLGEIPHGLPGPGIPVLTRTDWNELLPLAVACFLLGAVETAAIGRMFASKYGLRFDPNREFLALAAANVAAGFGKGYPVSGGMSQSLVNESAGGRTPVSGLVAAGAMLLLVLFFSSVLKDLPQASLAAIVLMAALSLFKGAELRHLWRTSRGEFAIALVAMLGVLGAGVLQGVMIGVILSLLMVARRSANPHVAVLGRAPGTRIYTDLQRHPTNTPIPGLLICRPESALLFFNAEYVRDRIMEAVSQQMECPRVVICDLAASPHVDAQSAHMLADLHRDLQKQGIRLQIVEALASVRDTLRRQGLEERLGRLSRFHTLEDAIDEFERGGAAPSDLPTDPAPADLGGVLSA
jgi:SulP family sulfate permease